MLYLVLHIGVKFSPPIAKDILDAKDGAALRLVYQLKMQSEQQKQAKSSVNSSQKFGATLAPAAKPVYDKLGQQRLEQSLRVAANANVKERDMAFHLQKFQDTFSANMYEATRPLPDLKRLQQLQDRQRELKKLEEQAWRKSDELGRAQSDWNGNQTKARERVLEQERFRAAQRAAEEEKETQRRAQQANSVVTGIDEFETNLERLGVSANTGDNGDDDLVSVDPKEEQSPSEHLVFLKKKLPSQADFDQQAQKQQNNILEKVAADKVCNLMF